MRLKLVVIENVIALADAATGELVDNVTVEEFQPMVIDGHQYNRFKAEIEL